MLNGKALKPVSKA